MQDMISTPHTGHDPSGDNDDGADATQMDANVDTSATPGMDIDTITDGKIPSTRISNGSIARDGSGEACNSVFPLVGNVKHAPERRQCGVVQGIGS